jgi:hypothetical protein
VSVSIFFKKKKENDEITVEKMLCPLLNNKKKSIATEKQNPSITLKKNLSSRQQRPM